jgi:hypothetical protein
VGEGFRGREGFRFGAATLESMGSDSRVLVRVVNETTLDRLDAEGLGYVPYKSGRWIEVPPNLDGTAVSGVLATEVVAFHISTSMDSIEIFISAHGRLVRRLQYGTGDRPGWKKPVGKPRPYEQTDRLDRWLKRKNLLASPDGYEVLDAVLGEAADRRSFRWSHYPPLDHAALSKALGVKVPKVSGFLSQSEDDGSAWLVELAPNYSGGYAAEGALPRWLLDCGARLVEEDRPQPRPWRVGRRLVSLPNSARFDRARRVEGLKAKKVVAFEVKAPSIVRGEKEPHYFWWLFVAEV